LLDEAVEEHATMLRETAVETERELVEVGLQMKVLQELGGGFSLAGLQEEERRPRSF
jgi:hypothetical protein